MVIVFYISGHGLGHASRDIELIRALLARSPGARVIVRTEAPRWLFETALGGSSVDVQACEADTGLIQIDSLHLDVEASARRAARFYAEFERRITEEAEHILEERAEIVLGDVPPLAFAAAHRAGVPSVAIGNFTWDWIYEAYPEFESLAPGVLDVIKGAHARTRLALRLPLHGGFITMPTVSDIPFIARKSVRPAAETRRSLGLDGTQPIVLASFGGYGLTFSHEGVIRSGLTLLAPDRAPEGFAYQDLVAAADVVVSKPGYGIVSECIANGTALLYTSRGSFAEYDVMAAEMPQWLRCRFIERERLLAGDWRDSVEALLAQPAPTGHPRIDGAQVAAELILAILSRR